MASEEPFFFFDCDTNKWPELRPFGNFGLLPRLPMACWAGDHMMYEAMLMRSKFGIIIDTSYFHKIPEGMSMTIYYLFKNKRMFVPPVWRKELNPTETRLRLSTLDASIYSLRNRIFLPDGMRAPEKAELTVEGNLKRVEAVAMFNTAPDVRSVAMVTPQETVAVKADDVAEVKIVTDVKKIAIEPEASAVADVKIVDDAKESVNESEVVIADEVISKDAGTSEDENLPAESCVKTCEVTIVYSDNIKVVSVPYDTQVKTILDYDKPSWILLNNQDIDERCTLQEIASGDMVLKLHVVGKPNLQMTYRQWLVQAQRMHFAFNGRKVQSLKAPRQGIGSYADQYSEVIVQLSDEDARYEMYQGILNVNGTYDLEISVDSSRYNYVEITFESENAFRVNGGNYVSKHSRFKIPIYESLRNSGELVKFSINSAHEKTFYIRKIFRRVDDEFGELSLSSYPYRLTFCGMNTVHDKISSVIRLRDYLEFTGHDLTAKELPPEITNDMLLGMLKSLLLTMNFSNDGSTLRRYISEIKHPERSFMTNVVYQLEGSLVHGIATSHDVMMRVDRGIFVVYFENYVGNFSNYDYDDINKIR